MKKLIISLFVLAILINACKNDKENVRDVFSKVYTAENLTKQIFFIHADKDTVLKGKSGTILRIYKNTFIDSKRKIVNDSIQIDFIEALTTFDMVMANLTTTSNGRILESGGMIYINAFSNNEQLEIANGKLIGAIIPTNKVQMDMKIFEGITDSSGINWGNPRPILNQQFSIGELALLRPIVKIGKIKDSTKLDQDKGNFRNEGQKNDTSLDVDNIFVQELRQTKGTNNFIEDYNTNYIFTVKKLGWANIDRLYSDPRTKKVVLITMIENQKDFQMIYVTMIISKIYIPGYQKEDNTFSFTHGDYENTELPIGEQATILATAYKNDKPYFAIKKIVITESQTVSFKLEESTKDKLKAALEKQI